MISLKSGRMQLRRLLYVVGDENRRRLFWVLCLTIIVAFLDFVSIGGIFPLLTLMFDPKREPGAANSAMSGFLLPVRMPAPSVLALLVVLAFVVKALVAAYSFRASFKFSYGVQVSIARRMLRSLARPNRWLMSKRSPNTPTGCRA